MNLSKLSDTDLQALKEGDLSKVSTEGLMEIKSQQQPDWFNEPGLEDATVSTIKNLGTMTKAGGAGISNLIAGNDMQQASEDVGKVMEGERPETRSGKVGEFTGGLFTPAQIALQGGMEAFLAASGIGQLATNILKGWGEKAALAAIGYVKSIGKAVGLENLSGLAQFLLQPVTIGGKELPAIVTATNDAPAMLKAAQAMKTAAYQELKTASTAVDAAIKQATEMGGDAPVAIDLAGLEKAATALKTEVETITPNLGKAVINQYDNALLDIQNLIKKSLAGDSKAVFSDLSKLKTTIGDLVYKHGSPLESKAALNDVYHIVSNTLDEAAKKTGGAVGAAYDAANALYNKAATVESALEGKALSSAAKGFFSDIGSMGVGMMAGFLNPALAIPTAIGTHLARNYGPQAIAAGLDAAAPLLGSALRTGVRALPVVGNAVAQGLSDNQ